MSVNLWSLIEPSFTRHGDHPAWICRQRQGKRIVSYRELEQSTLTLADQLRQKGIGSGHTVGVTAPNGPEWCVATLAAWRVGAAVAPIHIGNSDHEIEMQIAAVKPEIMLVHDSDISVDNAHSIDMAIDSEAIERERQQNTLADPDEVAVRIYTSGSTGSPKVVRLAHRNIGSNVLSAERIEHFTPNDRMLALLPFSHAMGITGNFLLSLRVGGTIVAPKVLAANEILTALEEEQISVIIAVPRLFRNVMLGLEKKFSQGSKALQMYIGLIRAMPISIRKHINAPIRKKFGGKIKIWVSGGSHLDGEITRYYHQLGLPLRQGYGLTETSPLTSIQSAWDDAVESVGAPIEDVEVKLHNVDENGNGEVWIKGPNVMLGYEDESQTQEAMEDGWFKSGDIARLDEKGRIHLTGRSKRLIVTEAGKNVYPEELETLLERNPLVKEAGVFERDMKPVVVLAMEGDDPAAEARKVLKEHNSLVSAHNQITRFALTDELPRTPVGKMALQQLPVIFDEFEVKS
ncbi:MAG: AMP-binding protein [Pseudomonadota bacterium]